MKIFEMILVGLALEILASPVMADPQAATVCEIVLSPAKYNDRELQIQARVESDGMHWLLLVDDHCPKLGLNFSYSARFAGSKDEKLIHQQVFLSPPLGTAYKDLNGLFSGKFMLDLGNPHPSERYKFVVETTRNLTVKQRPTKRLSPFSELR
jgi:hypothetical protein